MAVSESFRIFVLEQLDRVATSVRGRRMFGGLGIYSDDLFFALADDDVLYLKVDDSNRADFEARGMGPFMPAGYDGATMPYYEVPADALEDAEALRPWVEGAIAVAAAKRRSSARRTRSKRKPERRPVDE